METLINLWFVWLVLLLGCAAYTVLNQVDRMKSILAKIDLNLKDVAPLFFNGRKFTWFVIAAVMTFGFFILFSVSIFINIVHAIGVHVKLF
jgi:hypothetical protein